MLSETGEMAVNDNIRCVGRSACNVWAGTQGVRAATHLSACLGLDLTQEYMEFPGNSLVHSH